MSKAPHIPVRSVWQGVGIGFPSHKKPKSHAPVIPLSSTPVFLKRESGVDRRIRLAYAKKVKPA